MCTASCILFGAINLTKEEVKGKRIIEVGAYDDNGSLQPLFKSFNPSEYVGVDMVKGPGVDIICNAENLLNKFKKDSYDIVLTTEMLEHVKDWRRVISNLKNICCPGGTILITTRSRGFPVHGCPNDYWRYEVDDMRRIFADYDIQVLEPDKSAPGVFLKARKPVDFTENNLSEYPLYSMVARKKIIVLEDVSRLSFAAHNLRIGLRSILEKCRVFISSHI